MQQLTVNLNFDQLRDQFACFINELELSDTPSHQNKNVSYIVHTNYDITLFGKLDMLISSGYKIYCSFQPNLVHSTNVNRNNPFEKIQHYYVIKKPTLYFENVIDVKTVHPITYNYWKDQDTEHNYILPFLFSSSFGKMRGNNKRIEVLEKIIWLDPNYPVKMMSQSSPITPTPLIVSSSSDNTAKPIEKLQSSKYYLVMDRLMNKLIDYRTRDVALLKNYALFLKTSCTNHITASALKSGSMLRGGPGIQSYEELSPLMISLSNVIENDMDFNKIGQIIAEIMKNQWFKQPKFISEIFDISELETSFNFI